MTSPEHIALKYYRDYHSGSAKTLKSIQITLAARLEKFNLESLASLTATDELDLPSLGEKKVALFALIPDNDTSFNFLVSILYTRSFFSSLFYLADHKYGGSLPVHCHFIMDEFANVSLPDDFDKILSVMRSRGVSVSPLSCKIWHSSKPCLRSNGKALSATVMSFSISAAMNRVPTSMCRSC
jgi:type IV secretion system protein VirD4